ncbi:MAG: NAD(P)-binding domain-containing protein, partial [Deltaproteobacteria bacterium]
MKLGYVGLGKMGFGMVELMLEKGHQVVAYNRHKEVIAEIEKKGAKGTESYETLVSSLPKPRTIWLMVSHQAVDEVIGKLLPLIEKGDTIIDGGNSPYKESIRRAKELEAKGIDFLDAGVSGGPGGARSGACI